MSYVKGQQQPMLPIDKQTMRKGGSRKIKKKKKTPFLDHSKHVDALVWIFFPFFNVCVWLVNVENTGCLGGGQTTTSSECRQGAQTRRSAHVPAPELQTLSLPETDKGPVPEQRVATASAQNVPGERPRAESAPWRAAQTSR